VVSSRCRSSHHPLAASCSLEEDQCAALNALGGLRATGVILSGSAGKMTAAETFANERNLYFFYAAEHKDKEAKAWADELVAQSALADIANGASAFVHVLDEAHVSDTWSNFRPSFGNYAVFLSRTLKHHLVRLAHGMLFQVAINGCLCLLLPHSWSSPPRCPRPRSSRSFSRRSRLPCASRR
jgi:hypothetical protein